MGFLFFGVFLALVLLLSVQGHLTSATHYIHRFKTTSFQRSLQVNYLDIVVLDIGGLC